MRKKRDPETDQQRSERLEAEAQRRRADEASADDAIDARVKRSIRLHGP